MARYQVFLDSPLGERCGMLTLQENSGEIRGVLSILGVDNPVTGKYNGGVVFLRHMLRTRVSALECSTELHLEGSTLHGTVHVGDTLINLRGTERQEEIQQAEEKEHRNHGKSDHA